MFIFSIGSLVKFTKINKNKVISLPPNERVNEMYNLIHAAGLSYEFEDRCSDELEDTYYEINVLLEIDAI